MEPGEVDFSGKFSVRLANVPKGIRWVAYARTIRWFGWGFGEALLPVFILSFSASLTEAGLLSSAYDLLFLLSLPIVGFLSDVISSRTLLIAGLLLYPFIGISYYLAGALGLVLFVIVARAINGVAYCIDSIGTDTYIRRISSRRGIASAFGFMSSLTNLGWLISALIGAYLVRYISISVLLSFVTPFALIALIPLIRAEKDRPAARPKPSARTFLHPLAGFLKEFAAMRKGLRSVVVLMFLLDAASVAATFFIPIAAFKNGASLSAVAILCVISVTPTLTEFWLAEFIDGSRAKRRWSLFIALAALPVLFLVASFLSSFPARIIIAFGIELAAILASLALQSYATMLSRRDRYGEVSSMLEGATTLGDLAAPLAIGLLTDAVGFSTMFVIVATIFAVIAGYFFRHPIAR